jgi:hypothetical protein
MPGEDNLRMLIFRLRRAARDATFATPPRIKLGITRAMGRELVRTLRRDEETPVMARDGLGRAIYRLDMGDIVVEWLA